MRIFNEKEKGEFKKNGVPRHRKIKISYEILPPGTLKRNSLNNVNTPKNRWEEIIDVCVRVVFRDVG